MARVGEYQDTTELDLARDSILRELTRTVGETNAPMFLARLERLIEAKISEQTSRLAFNPFPR